MPYLDPHISAQLLIEISAKRGEGVFKEGLMEGCGVVRPLRFFMTRTETSLSPHLQSASK